MVKKKKNRKRKWRRRLGLLVTLAIVIGTCYYGPKLYRNVVTWWGKEVRFPLKTVSVEGNHYVPADSLMAMASLPLGSSVFSLDLMGIAHRMEVHPWIEKAHLYRRLPYAVVISIQEVEPLAMIPGNPMGVIGGNGNYLGSIWRGVTWDLPIMAGMSTNRWKTGKKITSETALALINCAQEIQMREPEVFQLISDFRISKEHIFLTLGDGKSQIQLQKNPKIVSWQILKEFLIQRRRDFADQAIRIDLRFPQWVIVSPIS